MSLRKKQSQFAHMIGRLIVWAYENGYELTGGDWNRPDKKGHMRNSLHYIRLAMDFNLFIDGKYQTTTEAYRPLGEFWEAMGGSWGGRFEDGNHFSLEYEGRK